MPPLQKQNVSINFRQGLDTKTDPFQLQIGKFQSLENMVFTTGDLLKKRNGYQELPTLPATVTTLTTFNGNLIGTGTSLYALLSGDLQWVNQGRIQPVALSVLPIVRSFTAQVTVDTAVSTANSLICSTWVDSVPLPYYQIQDSVTGQIIVSPTLLPTGAKNPRVFQFAQYFIVSYTISISSTPHLEFIPIPLLSPQTPGSPVSVSAQVSSDTAPYDGAVVGMYLFFSWNGSDGGGALRTTFVQANLIIGTPAVVSGITAALISLTADNVNSILWVSLVTSGNAIRVLAYDTATPLGAVLANTLAVASAANVNHLSSAANAGVLTLFWETAKNYSYASLPTDFITSMTVTQAGVLGTPAVILRSVGLASKGFIINGTAYVLAVYGSATSGLLQPSYFLSDALGNVIARLAYSNGGGYYTTFVLPSVSITSSNVARIGYLFKDLIAAVNPGSLTPIPATTPQTNIYSQTGINIATFDLSENSLSNVEIGSNLNFGAGFVWAYDGVKPVEQNFLLFPEDVTAVWSASGGSIAAQPDGATNTDAYFYQATYEWTDGQGNIHRSAPSIPVAVTTSGSASAGSITVNIPKLRITYKTGMNQVRIVLYRWSVANQVYYQVTSITSPVANNSGGDLDSVAIVDTLADASIIGNNIIYTTGGVVENISPPGTNAMTLFRSRLFLIDSEDPNLLWYSKQVIENTPVEMSDLFTIFVSPTEGAQGSTGPMKALAPLDDKLIIFKRDAIYYLVGTGPDNTGANNDFSSPIFITSTVGSIIQQSITSMPSGLMFDSDKGRWLLGRDLSTQYIGAPVEAFNSSPVTSALTIPGTNQVRMTLNQNATLMYDYYYGQWGSFSTSNVVSATLFQNTQTYVDIYNRVLQESPDSYIDGPEPVLMSFTTGWLNLAGLQGFERIYYFYLLGTYQSPHKLWIQIAYDYNPPSQSVVWTPLNTSGTYGSAPYYGNNLYGGSNSLEQFRVFTNKQKVQAFQISVSEIYNSEVGQPPGAGLTLSGINAVIGLKKGYVPVPAVQSIG